MNSAIVSLKRLWMSSMLVMSLSSSNSRVFAHRAILSTAHKLNLLCGVFILHLTGGLHNYWDGLFPQ